MNVFGKVTGALVGALFGPFGLLVGLLLGHLADLSSGGWHRGGVFGAETPVLAQKIAVLWGLVAGHGGSPNPSQVLFLQSVWTGQLGLAAPEARRALSAFGAAVETSAAWTWTQRLADVTNVAREIREEYRFDQRTLLWIAATAARLAALGQVRTGLAELLGAVASVFGLGGDLGGFGFSDSSSGSGAYEQTWKGFRPAAEADESTYRSLGLTPEATVDEVKKAYRLLARQFHPDAQSHLPEGSAERQRASERFLEVQQAYEQIRRARSF